MYDENSDIVKQIRAKHYQEYKNIEEACGVPVRYNIEAAFFARILLMPHKKMRKLLKTSDEKVAKRFGTPIEQVILRKAEVDSEKYALLYGLKTR